jgi:hypothetical protein
MYKGVSESYRTESVRKYKLTFRLIAEKLTRLTHKIVIQLHLLAESCTVCNSRSRWPVRKLLDIPSYVSLRNEVYWIELAQNIVE